ncbi:MAG TPA: methyl-accepting chemotaxis protein [Polyangiaceae bacterium]
MTNLPGGSPEIASFIESLECHRESIGARIRDANGMTEREVLAVGEALKLIVDEARSYVKDSRATLEEFASTNLSDMLDRHGALMTQFVSTMQTQVSAQSDAARQATSQINGIVELGQTIDRVTMESKILALNANIQARRLGVAGQSFQVIAQEMKRFSESVSEANKRVQDLATSLLNVLPRIESLAAELRKTSEGFSSDVNNRIAEVAMTNSELKEQVANSMSSGEVRLQQIVHLSHDALSHLQFQDSVAQSLLSCDAMIRECVHDVERWANGDGVPRETATAAAEACSAPDSSIESGEVLLF